MVATPVGTTAPIYMKVNFPKWNNNQSQLYSQPLDRLSPGSCWKKKKKNRDECSYIFYHFLPQTQKRREVVTDYRSGSR